ncbi:carotenoid 1,2-hydratase [Nannocystis pusilla]|uniref:carotenoid 1,2-hydratase n=1 Tax=Nannocystis pusilla TaxID=889268 RepID=UPI003BEF75E6
MRGPQFDRLVPPGGYGWWYLDALSDDGSHGLTIIAFVGSVFSPYYAKARARAPAGAADPMAHCAINVALYGPGVDAWVFTEYGASEVERRPDRLQVGGSSMAWEGDCLVVRFDERTAVLGQRVAGTVRLYPSAFPDRPERLDARGRHTWFPAAPHAHVEAELSTPALTLRGTGYHDANFGEEPLEAAFVDWSWSRAALPDRTVVLYDARRRDGSQLQLGRVFHADGHVEPLAAAHAMTLGRTRWWIPRSTRTDGAPATVIRTLEDTPFYARTQVATRVGEVPVRAVHESLSLSRFCSPLVQTMLPFRIRRVS